MFIKQDSYKFQIYILKFQILEFSNSIFTKYQLNLN